MTSRGIQRKLSWETVAVVALAVVLASPIAIGSAVSGVLDQPELRFAVGFYEMRENYQIGDSYHGGRIVGVNTDINFISVVTRNPDALTSEQFTDSNVKYVEEQKTYKMIEDSFVADPDPTPLLKDVVPESPSGAFKHGPDEGSPADFTPNDPQYSSMYGPQQTRVNLAWDTTLGNSANAAVCVIDTGIRYTHQDLSGSRWKGGHDYVNNDNDPADDNGHGTHVSGTAAGTINNGLNVAGMGNTALYMVKVLDAAGSGTFDNVANGITWCADNTPAHTVISMSLGGPSGTTALQNAVQYAVNTKGKIIVAAAGNDGPCSNCVGYPGAYPEVIAVSCTTSAEALCSFSSTGPQVSLAAPGNSILSTWNTGDTATNTISGTSMSTPHVSGILALYWSWDTAITGSALRTRAQNTAKDLGAAGKDNNFGYGRIDAKCLFDNTNPCGGGGGGGCTGGPTNNCFSSPKAASGLTYTDSESTSGATTESGEPAPCGSIGATVWYTYTPANSGTMTVETTGSSYDTVVAAYTGSTLTGLTNVACNDDTGGGLQSKVSFTATAGTTYRLQAGGYQGATGTLSFKITGPPSQSCTGPANNCFSTATSITTKPYTTTESTSGATLETGEPRPCGSIGATVWFTYTPSASGTITFDTSGSNFDTVLAAYTGSTLTGLTNVACNDDTGGTLQSKISFTASAGTTYRIQVGGYNSATGSLTFHLT